MTQMQLETKRRNKFFLSIQQNGDRTVGWREQQNRRRENPLEWRVDGDDPTNCLKKRNFSSRLFVSPFERVLKTIQKRTRLIYSKCSLSSPLEKEREREREKEDSVRGWKWATTRPTDCFLSVSISCSPISVHLSPSLSSCY